MRTLDQLRKEINGKQVVYVQDALKMNALMISPPGGEGVSIKPYGYTPEETSKMLRGSGFDYSVGEVSKPEFCLLFCKLKEDVRCHLETMADMKSESKLSLGTRGIFNPSCPYG